MGAQKVTVCVNAFFGTGQNANDEMDLWFPEDWEVRECRMAGHGMPALDDEAMRRALRNPFGAPRLSELAVGKERVCILFDDLPKPTPTSRIAPFVLEELHAGGIDDDQIRFVCGPGTHRAMIYPEFAAKLGREIVENYPVYNHSMWQHLVEVGRTSRGTPVRVNREFASCDLRVGIGSLLQHRFAGFGGGGKLILPGISGVETIEQHHSKLADGVGLEGAFRHDLEEAARLAGLHFKVDSVLNDRREVIGLFAGDFVAEHRVAAEKAHELYQTQVVDGADVLVVNTFPNESQMARAWWCIPLSLRDGGDVVLATHSHEGQNLHQLASAFGTDLGGSMYKPRTRLGAFEKAGRVIVLAPHLSRYDRDQLAPLKQLSWCRSWAEALAELAGRHGAGTRVGVYPCAGFQTPAEVPVEEGSEEQGVPVAVPAG